MHHFHSFGRLGISFICVTHHEVSGFYRNKGRPSNETKKRLSVPAAMKAGIDKLRKEMNYEQGTDIVLILSFVSYVIMCMVHMFPEVFFMDVTCSTN